MVEENKNATHTSPPVIRRASSAVGSKAKLKITTTNSAKKSMALSASLERHSSRRSLPKVEMVVRTKLAEEEAGRSCMATVFSPACSIMRLRH